jgi:hypothetical protein
MEWILFTLQDGKPKDLQFRIIAISFVANL